MSIRPLYNRIARARRLAAASTPSAAPAPIADEGGAAPSTVPQQEPLAAETPAPSKPRKPKSNSKASKASNTSQPSPTINPNQ